MQAGKLCKQAVQASKQASCASKQAVQASKQAAKQASKQASKQAVQASKGTCKEGRHIPSDLVALRVAKVVYVVQAVYVGQCEEHLVGAAVHRLWQLVALPVWGGAGQEDGLGDDALHVAAHVADEVHADQALHEGHHRLKAGKVCREEDLVGLEE